jgi:hypothetical protein
MASNSKKTSMKRIRKTRAAGKARKRIARRGTTPVFPIHTAQHALDAAAAAAAAPADK